jgi:hypothetical protein
MVIGKKQGIVILIFGLCILTAGILVIITVPSWGNWVADYPAQAAQIAQTQAPAQAAPVIQAIINIVLGPIIHQVGQYVQTVGYFVGSLIILISLVICTVGTSIIRKTASATA